MGKLSENKGKKQMEVVLNRIKSAFVLPEKLAYALAFVGIALLIIGHYLDGPVLYMAYPISAYGTVTAIIALTKTITRWKKLLAEWWLWKQIRSLPLIGTLIADGKIRMRFFLYLGILMNGFYVVLNICGGIVYGSLWLSFLGGYYLALMVFRMIIIHFERFHDENENIAKEYIRYRNCGVILFLLDIILIFVIILAARFKAVINYPGIIIYGMAIHFFYSIIMAVYNLVTKRKIERPIFGAARIASFVAALVSALSLEFAMMARFGGDNLIKRRNMTVWTGSVIFTLILYMALMMIVIGSKNGKHS